MNGFQLYKQYISLGQRMGRGSAQWAYAQTLNEAFYLLGSTELFDLLEQAEAKDQCLVLDHPAAASPVTTTDARIKLVSREAVPVQSDCRPFDGWFNTYNFV